MYHTILENIYPSLITVSNRNYCMPYGIVPHAFPVMSYILLMKYQYFYRYISQI